MKKVLSALIVAVMLIGMLPAIAIPASAGSNGILSYTVSNNKATITYCVSYVTGELEIPATLGGCPVTTIGDSAFENCFNLTSISIPDSVTTIGDYAFSYCDSLMSITIPDSVTTIGEYAFNDCTGLTSITIPDSVLSIGEDAFAGCINLNEVYISDIAAWCQIDFNYKSYTNSAGTNPLNYAENLYLDGVLITDLIIPEGVASIKAGAFLAYSNLKSVTIPSSVGFIGESAFLYCSKLKKVYINDLASWFELDFEGNGANPCNNGAYLYLNGRLIEEITIPNNIYTIKNYALSGCISLKSVVISQSVQSIGDYAFDGCENLVSVETPDYLNSIGTLAFADCENLRTIVIPEGVEVIQPGTFSGAGLYSVTIPSSVKSIEDFGFECSELKEVCISDLDAWLNIEIRSDPWAIAHPLQFTKHLYLNGELLKEVVIPNEIAKIPMYSLNSADINSVELSTSVVIIEKVAFGTGLHRIFLPKELETISENAFGLTNDLTRVYYGGSEEDLENLIIESGNENLKNAKWSFNETGLPDHSFTNACDKDCNECGVLRIVEDHKYTNACDKDCNECGSLRTPAAHKGGTATCKEKAKCSVCGVAYGSLADHKFGGYVYNNDATSKKDGTKTRTCSVCKKTETVTATGTKLQNPFKDVKLDQYYAEPVLWAVGKNITNGMSANSFAPNDDCTRGQIVTFLWRAAGSPEPTSTKNPFKDVKSNQYYYKAVLWAVEKGITNGTSANTFSPDATCTRAQVVTFLWRAKGSPKVSATNPFKDVKKSYYSDAVLWAVKNNITTGISATQFAPDNTCTRGQIVTFLYRAYK